MQDAITALINSSDVQGRYLDDSGLERLTAYFHSGELRARSALTISANANTLVTQAVFSRFLLFITGFVHHGNNTDVS